MNKYFTIPFANVPQNPDYTVWFAAWSVTRPIIEPGMRPPVVIGMTTGTLPPGAKLIEEGGTKQPPPPPPPLINEGMDAYQKAFKVWLEGTMGE